MVGGHRIQVFFVKVAAFVESGPVGLGVVELEALHPLSRRCFVSPFFQTRLDLLESWHVAVGGHHMAHAAAQNVDVRVDETWQHGLPAHVQHLGVRPDQAFHVLVAADPGKPAVGHGHRLGPG